jgi:hypothetical protein
MLRTDSGGDNLFVKLFTQILANRLVMEFWIAKPNFGNYCCNYLRYFEFESE